MFDRPTTLRERLAHDGWGDTAREGFRRARKGTRRFGDRMKHAGVRARKEASKTGKRISRAMPKQRARRERRRRVALLAGGTVLGATAAYLFDPVQGRGRRSRLMDRMAGVVRRATRRAERAGSRVASDAEGFSERVRHSTRDYTPPNDATLARKVESEVLGRPEVPSGSILVNAEHGVVVLRGEVERPGLVRELEDAVRRVEGVLGVENLLHTPGEPVPNEAGARGVR